MRISDWSSDVCSSDLGASPDHGARHKFGHQEPRVAPLPLRWSGDRSTAYRSAYGATREFAALDGGKQEHCTRYSERRIVLRQDERSGWKCCSAGRSLYDPETSKSGRDRDPQPEEIGRAHV